MKIIPCIGMKRSGSTLQFNSVLSVLEQSGCRYLNLQYIHDMRDYDADWSSLAAEYDFVVFKSHDVTCLEQLPEDTIVKPLFIYRDVRDAYLSAKIKWNWSIDQIPRVVEEHRFALRYVNERSDNLIQNYEEFYSNKGKAVQEIADFLTLPLSEEQASSLLKPGQVVSYPKRLLFRSIYRMAFLRKKIPMQKTKFERTILRKLALGAIHKMIDPETQMHPDHFSKRAGAPGGWVEGLSDEEKAIFESLEVHGRATLN